MNVGDAETSGTVTIVDNLPPGLSVQSVSLFATLTGNEENLGGSLCSMTMPRVICTFPADMRPYERLEIRLAVKVEENVQANLDNEVLAEGGEAPGAVARFPVTCRCRTYLVWYRKLSSYCQKMKAAYLIRRQAPIRFS